MTVYNKVIINNQTLMDISSDTVTPNTLLTGVTAHDNTGAAIIGTYTPPPGEIINNQDKTITPTTSQQSITADNGYTGLGTVTINAIQIETKSITENGTYTPPAGKWFSSVKVNVPIGSTINNQNKSVTPTKSQQSVSADSGYTGLGTVTVNAIPSQYITTTDATAVAADVLLNKTAYVNGSKITGSMPNNGATGTTITSPSGSYTIPVGYTTGGTVNVDLPVSTLTNSIINGSAELEDTNDYAFEVEVNIPAGYHNATTLTKSFSSILPAPDSAIAENQMLAGYQAYSADGELLTGSMVNNGTWSRTLDQTTTSVTIPAGYHNGSGTVGHTTVDIPDPTISVNSSGLITASGSWTRGFTIDSSYSKTQQLTTQAAKTVTPTESEQNVVAAGVYTTGIIKVGAIPSGYVGSDITQRDSDDLTVSGATVTAPAGYYSAAASKSVATMTLPTAASSTSTNGATRKATINRSSSIQYINIPTGYNSTAAYYQVNAVADGVATAPSTITGTDATLSTGTNTLTLSKILSVTPRITTAGYVSGGTAGDSMVTLSTSIPTRNEGSISVSGKTVTVPAGYYAEQSSVEVNTMTLPTSVSETSAGSRKLTVSPSTSVQYINIPTGYNESAGYYRIDAMTEGTVTAPSTISGTGASVQSTGSNTVTVRGTVSVTPNVTTAGYIDAGTAGNSTVTLSVNMTTKAASTITPGASAQTISGGIYLTGTQTIAGDADLVAGNIKSGVNIFGVSGTFTSDATAGPTEIVSGATAYVDGDLVTGTLTVNKYYTGTTAPSASLGNNGDIYLQQ